MIRRALPLFLFVGVVACGGGSGGGGNPTGPSNPTPPPPSAFSLTGKVTDSTNGAGITGATVTIVDGPVAGRSTTTNGAGDYTFPSIPQSGFTVRARAQFYNETSDGVNLIADRTLNLRLIPIPIFSRTGGGNFVFDMPTHVRRVEIFGRWNGRGTSNFIVRIGSSTVVNAILRNGNPYTGVHATTGGVVEIRSSENITEWRFTEIR